MAKLQWRCVNNNGTHDFRQLLKQDSLGNLGPAGFYCTRCLVIAAGREDFQTDDLTVPEQ
jgi:hypothetical protein